MLAGVFFGLASTAGPAPGQEVDPYEALRRMKEAERRAEAAEADGAGTDEPAADRQEQPVAYAELPEGLQRRFEREAANYVRIGDRLWSVELLRRFENTSTHARENAEPYQDANAPLIYDPVGEQRARQFKQIDPEAADLALVEGSVVLVHPRAVMLRTAYGLVYLSDLAEGHGFETGDELRVIGRRNGEKDYRLGPEKKKAPRFDRVTDARVQLVGGEELAIYLQQHQIERFDRWRFRKVWDERPKAKKVYVRTDGRGVQQGGTGAGVSSSEPVEVITDPGKYHWQWTRGGQRVPHLPPLKTDGPAAADENDKPDPAPDEQA